MLLSHLSTRGHNPHRRERRRLALDLRSPPRKVERRGRDRFLADGGGASVRDGGTGRTPARRQRSHAPRQSPRPPVYRDSPAQHYHLAIWRGRDIIGS